MKQIAHDPNTATDGNASNANNGTDADQGKKREKRNKKPATAAREPRKSESKSNDDARPRVSLGLTKRASVASSRFALGPDASIGFGGRGRKIQAVVIPQLAAAGGGGPLQ